MQTRDFTRRHQGNYTSKVGQSIPARIRPNIPPLSSGKEVALARLFCRYQWYDRCR